MRMFGPKGNPRRESVCGDQLSSGARRNTPGSQSTEGGIGCYVASSIGKVQREIARIKYKYKYKTYSPIGEIWTVPDLC